MKTSIVTAMIVGAFALGTAAYADPPAQNQPTPKGWSYEIRNGQRVPIRDRCQTQQAAQTVFFLGGDLHVPRLRNLHFSFSSSYF